MAKKSISEDTKKTFIESLIYMDRDQIRDFISRKGKDPKLIKPVLIIKNQKNTQINTTD